LAAILFEMTMEQKVDGLPTAEYLWHRKGIVPFLKVDNGLLPEANGVQLMKPIPELTTRLEKSNRYGIFGTKERSVIKESNATGISACVDQQFEVAEQVLEADLVPIIEPEVDINSGEKPWIEHILKRTLIEALNSLDESQSVMLKLTIPSEANFYSDLISHPRVLRVVALSGGYSRAQADELLQRNTGLIASFSRALTEGLTAQQSDAQFDEGLDSSIQEIYDASTKLKVMG
jgi:fructose-bisphosphate aldolase class I